MPRRGSHRRLLLQCSAPDAVVDLVSRGLGVAVLSATMAAGYADRLHAVPVDDVTTPALLGLGVAPGTASGDATLPGTPTVVRSGFGGHLMNEDPEDLFDTAEVLAERGDGRVVRRGDVVHRPLSPWSASVHQLLEHLLQVGFTAAPRLVDVDETGETLTYLDGESGPDGWAKVVDLDGLRAAARLLRRYHDAVRGWRPTNAGELVWADGSSGAGTGDDIVCHGDVGPWNMVWSDHVPVGADRLGLRPCRPGRQRRGVRPRVHGAFPIRRRSRALAAIPGAAGSGWADRGVRAGVRPDQHGRAGDAVESEQVRGRQLVLSLAGREPRQVAMMADGHLDELTVGWTRSHRHLTG